MRIEEIIIIDDFRADSMQFNELLILLDPLSQRTSNLARYRNKFIQHLAIITAPEPIENLYFMTQEDVTQLESEDQNFLSWPSNPPQTK